MNHSGQAIGELARYFKIEVAGVLVVVDEVHLPLGKLRGRARGSAGGHNGLEVGDCAPGATSSRGSGSASAAVKQRRDMADHVLSRFDKDEAAEVAHMTWRAAEAVGTLHHVPRSRR